MCEPEPRAGVPVGAVLKAAGVLAAVVVGVKVAAAVGSFAAAVVAVEGVAAAVLVAAVVRQLRPRREAAKLAASAELQRAPYRIPAPPLAIAPRVVAGEVVTERERMRA